MNSANIYTISPEEEKYLSARPVGKRIPRILVAPLDWGLGHATRCIPIIHELLKQNCEVWLAAEGAQEVLLKQEFPNLPFLHLQGYRVKYGHSMAGTWWNIFIQSRKILRTINNENDWLKKAVAENGFDAVIADNRYGLYHEKIPCIFITHQLTIKNPLGKWAESYLQKRNYQYINRFTECWVPDEKGENNLAGELSHPQKKPAIPVEYIGSLSRFEDLKDLPGTNLLIILSGPEPQRSILEEKIIKEIVHYNGTAVVVRGLPGTANLIPSTNTIRFYNHLPAEELNKEMNAAEYIISRSGYSTVMDLVKLQKRSILIPTPGQTEQEYLAEYLSGKKIACTVSQKTFSLFQALRSAGSFAFSVPVIENENKFQQVVSRFVQSLRDSS